MRWRCLANALFAALNAGVPPAVPVNTAMDWTLQAQVVLPTAPADCLLPLLRRNVEGSHLVGVAHQQAATGDCRIIPGLTFNSSKARDF